MRAKSPAYRMRVAAIVAVALACALPSSASASTTKTAIVGGSAVSQARFDSEFPFQVALLRKNDVDTFVCGGSLIAPQWVLTAAHCKATLEGVVPRYVVVGRADLSNEGVGEVIQVAGTYQHPAWLDGENGSRGDMMLIKLARPTAQPAIALAPSDWLPAAGALGVVSGWGLTRQSNRSPEQVLRTTQLELRSLSSCRRNWGQQIAASMICAGQASAAFKSVCSGDSGGPLVSSGLLVGITSFTSDSCRSNPYNVFTRVSSYSAYIARFMQRQVAPADWLKVFSASGPRRTREIRLRNPSAETVQIGDISIEYGPFRLLGDNCGDAVAPGAGCSVRVKSLGANRYGALRVATDSLASPVLRVDLFAR